MFNEAPPKGLVPVTVKLNGSTFRSYETIELNEVLMVLVGFYTPEHKTKVSRALNISEAFLFGCEYSEKNPLVFFKIKTGIINDSLKMNGNEAIALMEKILQIKKAFNIKDVECSIIPLE